MSNKEKELQKIAENINTSSALSDEDTELYLNTALDAGRIALENGAETARGYTIIQHILKSSGSENCVTSVLSKSIIASLNGKTQIITLDNWSVNLNKIIAVNDISHKLADGRMDIQGAATALKALDQTAVYNFILRLLSYMIVTAAMPIFMNGTIVDCGAAAACGVVMAFVDALFRRIRIHAFATIAIQSFIMILLGSLTAFLTQGRIVLGIIMTSAITPMFPGLALTNAVRDTLQGDYVSGAGRLLEAFVHALAISLGVAMGLTLATFATGSLSQNMYDSPFGVLTDNPALFVIYAAAALVYSAGYCILFDVTPKYVIWGALVGCAAKTLCLYINYHSGTVIIGTFVATALAATLAQILSKVFKTPAIPFLIAGIMALVPGNTLYSSVYMIITGNFAQGGDELLRTLIIAGTIAVAIFLVDTIFLTARRIRRKRIIRK